MTSPEIRAHFDVLEFDCAPEEVYDETPGMVLEASTLSKITALGASIDIDLYVLSHTDDGPGS